MTTINRRVIWIWALHNFPLKYQTSLRWLLCAYYSPTTQTSLHAGEQTYKRE
jgi:hypothetical protein